VDSRVVSGDHVEPVLGGDDLAFMSLDDDLLAPVHRGIHRRKNLGADQGGVIDQQGPAFQHGLEYGPVLELISAVVLLGPVPDQVPDRGVPIARDRDQIVERGLGHGGLSGARGSVEQCGDSGIPQPSEGLYIGDSRCQRAGVVELPVGAGDRPGLGRGLLSGGGGVRSCTAGILGVVLVEPAGRDGRGGMP
jgi:hypothetical protein